MFQTARLTLRAFRAADADTIADDYNNPAVQARRSIEYIVPRPDAARAAALAAYVRGCTLFAVVEATAGGTYVGNVSLRGLRARDRSAEVGLAIAQGAWGRGYATEVMAWLVEHAFRGMGLHRLSLWVHATNAAAIRVYEKAGFVREGVRRKATWIDGEWVDGVAMGVVQDEFWAAQRGAREVDGM